MLNFETFTELLKKNFVDMYFYENYMLIKDFSDIKKINFKKPIKIKTIIEYVNKINENNKVNIHIPYWKENFSFYYNNWWAKDLQWFRGLYWQEIKWEYLNIRKLWQPKDLDEFIEDPLLKKMLAWSFLYDKWTIISWKTGSWKTTLLISFFSFLNKETPQSYTLKKKKEFLKYCWINIDTQDVDNYFNNNLSEENKELFYSNLEDDVLYKMLNYIEKENRKVVYTIENPIEFYFQSNIMNFIQNDIFLHWQENVIKNEIHNVKLSENIKNILTVINDIYKEWISYNKWKWIVEQTNIFSKMLRTNPDLSLIWEIRNQVEFDWFLKSIAVWIPTYTTLHSDDAFSTLQRLYDTSSLSHLEKINLISSAIYWIINTKIFYSKVLNKVIPFFDILFLEDEGTRLELYNFLKDWQLYKLWDKLKDLWTKKIDDDKWKVIYLNKKSSLLYNLYKNYYNNPILQDDNIMNKWIEELKFLFSRYRITELDIDKFPSYYYHYENDINQNNFSIFKDFLMQNNIVHI